MQLTIALRKEVADIAQGQQLFDIVKNKLSEHPEVVITGQISESLIILPEEPTA